MTLSKRTATGLFLVCLLLLTYSLFFSGTVVSGDERFIIDTIDSLATRGSLLLNQTVFERPLQTSDVEPALPLLAVPLYWLAYQVPWVGNVHVLYLFSPIVTALTAFILYRFALLLKYDQRVALIGALAFGLTTFAWPYAKTLFREPLTMLLVAVVAFCAEKWRQLFMENDKQHWLWLVGVLLALSVALSSKEAVWMLLPTFALIVLPTQLKLRHNLVALATVALLAVALLAGLGFFLTNFDTLFNTDSGRYDLLEQARKLPGRVPDSWGGFSGFIFSPGRSIWVFAPIVLLSLASPILLPLKRWRESWLILMTLIGYALVYAALRGPVWYGGVGWGPRYLLPILPLLLIATLPGIQWLLGHKPAGLVGLIMLLVLGFMIQFGGVMVRLSDYYDYMQSQTGVAAWQGPGLWTLRWSQAFGSLLYLPQAQPDVVWWLPPAPDWLAIVLLLGAITATAVMLVWVQGQEAIRLELALMVPVVMVGMTLFALNRMYDDFRYNGHRADLHTMRQVLETETTDENVILLNSPSYVEFFMNYYKGDAIWYSLPASPGEQYSCEQTPAVTSDVLSEQLNPDADTMVTSLVSGAAKTFAPVYFVGDRAPFAPCNTRPVERLISEDYYPISSTDYGVDIRLVTYLPINGPNVPGGTQQLTKPDYVDARFGESIVLDRVWQNYYGTTPWETEFYSNIRPGDMLGFTLIWESIAPIDTDYTVAFFIIAADGSIVFQEDAGPVNNFKPTSTWAVGETIYDHHGVVLPSDLPQGRYNVVVVLYDLLTLERLPIASADGEPLGDQLVIWSIDVGERDRAHLFRQ